MKGSNNLSYQRDDGSKVKFDNEANLTTEINDFLSDNKIDKTELKSLHYILYQNNNIKKQKKILKTTSNLKDLLNKLPVEGDIYNIKSKISNILKLSNSKNNDKQSGLQTYRSLRKEARSLGKDFIKKLQRSIGSKADGSFGPNTFKKYINDNPKWQKGSISDFLIEKSGINKKEQEKKGFFENISELFELNPLVKDFIGNNNYKKLIENLDSVKGSNIKNEFKSISNKNDYIRFINRYSRILAGEDTNKNIYNKNEKYLGKSILNIAIQEYNKGVNENDGSADKYWKDLGFNRSSKGSNNAWCSVFVNWLLKKSGQDYIKSNNQIARAKGFLGPEFRGSGHVGIKSSPTALLSGNSGNKVNNNTVYGTKVNRKPIGYVLPGDLNTKYINSDYKKIPKSIKSRSNFKISSFDFQDIPVGAIVVFDSYRGTR